MAELPENVQRFLKEYKALCDKWGCVVVSDGEEVTVSINDAAVMSCEYWGIEESTKHWFGAMRNFGVIR